MLTRALHLPAQLPLSENRGALEVHLFDRHLIALDDAEDDILAAALCRVLDPHVHLHILEALLALQHRRQDFLCPAHGLHIEGLIERDGDLQELHTLGQVFRRNAVAALDADIAELWPLPDRDLDDHSRVARPPSHDDVVEEAAVQQRPIITARSFPAERGSNARLQEEEHRVVLDADVAVDEDRLDDLSLRRLCLLYELLPEFLQHGTRRRTPARRVGCGDGLSRRQRGRWQQRRHRDQTNDGQDAAVTVVRGTANQVDLVHFSFARGIVREILYLFCH